MKELTVGEKQKYVMLDFQKRVTKFLGDYPDDKKGLDAFFPKAISAVSEFMLRYKDNSMQGYSYSLCKSYMDTLEEKYIAVVAIKEAENG